MTADRILSCTGLGAFVIGSISAFCILAYQCFAWLVTGIWPALPLDIIGSCIRSFGSGWIGLQIIYTLVLALPLSLVIFLIGFLMFWWLGMLSAAAYKKSAESAGKQATPAQTQA